MTEPSGMPRLQNLRPRLAQALAIILAATFTGCGTRIDTPLPDLTSRNEQPVMSATEQRQAVEALIAKRDGTAHPQAPSQAGAATDSKASGQQRSQQNPVRTDQPAPAR